MNTLELALAKQRLQLEAAEQRAALARHLEGLHPLFAAGDQALAGLQWLKRHPEAVVGGVAFLAVVRPGVRRMLWRWLKRALLAWRFWHTLGRT
ncbi:MAG: YqjK-like family protein [Rhodocyclaceae bacterium]|nr:YqjK-like family protein [Rhodocyclaceae bacterium]